MPEETALGELTKDSFEPLRGERFVVSAADVGELELELTEVLGSGLRGKAKREQFALHFDGPAKPILPQSIYRLENERMGVLEIFLVPVAGDEKGTTYEAVFT